MSKAGKRLLGAAKEMRATISLEEHVARAIAHLTKGRTWDHELSVARAAIAAVREHEGRVAAVPKVRSKARMILDEMLEGSPRPAFEAEDFGTPGFIEDQQPAPDPRALLGDIYELSNINEALRARIAKELGPTREDEPHSPAKGAEAMRAKCEAIVRGYNRHLCGADFVRGEVEDLINDAADDIAALKDNGESK